jgi:L-methionine (R)-S-oxide reductase
MAENISFDINLSREQIYQTLMPQIQALIAHEPDQIARMANLCAILHEIPGFFWVGFYFIRNQELVLGPFQGPVACSRFSIDKGVCGAAVRNKETIIVPNVDEFPGHIACSALSKSEIVIPILDDQYRVFAVLDVDSTCIGDFSDTDKRYLHQILEWI